MIADCMAVVMAGGDSRRMGRDKATVCLGDQTLLQRVMNVVRPLFAEVHVSVRQPRPDIEWPQLCDQHANAGPLAGVCAGLEQASASHLTWIFVVATDMPFVKPELIDALAQKRNGFQAVIPLAHGYPQPTAGFYSTDCLVVVRDVLNGTGKRSLRAVLESLNVCYVDEHELRRLDPELRSFLDLDTPQDVAAAKQREEL